MRDARGRLEDIKEAIAQIQKYATRGRRAFDQDELIRNWFLHHLLLIGEAAKALPHDLLDKSPEIPWKQVMGMRDFLVHRYFSIDPDVVWQTVESDLPKRKSAVERLLSDPGTPGTA